MHEAGGVDEEVAVGRACRCFGEEITSATQNSSYRATSLTKLTTAHRRCNVAKGLAGDGKA
jgi:hypothetical protein